MLIKKIKFKIKKKYFFIFLVLPLIIIFIIGLIALKENYRKQLVLKQEKQISSFLSNYDIDSVFQMIDREEKKAKREIVRSFILANLNLNSRQLEEEVNLIKYLSPLISKIETDPNKAESTYAYEFSSILNKTNLFNFNYENKQSLNQNGAFFLALADELAKIKPPSNYLNVHKMEVIILGGIGYSLKELSTTEDNERAMVLIRIINELIENQKKLADYLKIK